MLTEIALTPHVFQDGSGLPVPTRTENLRSLMKRLRGQAPVGALVFSNLNSGRADDWRKCAERLLHGTWASPQIRQLMMDLFQQLKAFQVDRPSLGHVTAVQDELHWCREAFAPHQDYRADHLFVSPRGHNFLSKRYLAVKNFDALDGDPLWSKLSSLVFPRMDIDDQIKHLRPLCRHARFLALVLPYGLTLEWGEADWALTFIASSLRRPAEFGVPEIELHVSTDGKEDAEVKSQQAGHRTIQPFIHEVEQLLHGHEFFRLFVRPRWHRKGRFISRRLFAGEYADVATGTPVLRIRWGVSLEHVATTKDKVDQTPPTWALLTRSEADRQFQIECRSQTLPLVGPLTIRGR